VAGGGHQETKEDASWQEQGRWTTQRAATTPPPPRPLGAALVQGPGTWEGQGDVVPAVWCVTHCSTVEEIALTFCADTRTGVSSIVLPPGRGPSQTQVPESFTEGAVQLDKLSVHPTLLFGALQGHLHTSGHGAHWESTP